MSPNEPLIPSRPNLRDDLTEQAAIDRTYPTCLTARQALTLLAVAEAARDFVATTSVFRQNVVSRDAFADLAFALQIAQERA